VPTEGFVEDVLRTDGAARENLLASLQAGERATRSRSSPA